MNKALYLALITVLAGASTVVASAGGKPHSPKHAVDENLQEVPQAANVDLDSSVDAKTPTPRAAGEDANAGEKAERSNGGKKAM